MSRRRSTPAARGPAASVQPCPAHPRTAPRPPTAQYSSPPWEQAYHTRVVRVLSPCNLSTTAEFRPVDDPRRAGGSLTLVGLITRVVITREPNWRIVSPQRRDREPSQVLSRPLRHAIEC